MSTLQQLPMGWEDSPLVTSMLPRPRLFPSCAKLSWAELHGIFAMLPLLDLYRGIGCVNKLGFILYQRERNYRMSPVYMSRCTLGDVTYLHRSDWILHRYISFAKRVWAIRDKVLLASYPRSGNSYLRKLLEKHTGIVTGSDSRSNRKLSASLLRFGFQGEGIVDSSVWIVKSHYPERIGAFVFTVQRSVLLVRNPFDTILSYFNMCFTNTHDKALTMDCISSEPLCRIWNDFFLSEAQVWKDFHDYYSRLKNDIPVLFVRYEDLTHTDKHEISIQNVLSFLQRDIQDPHTSVDVYSNTNGNVFHAVSNQEEPGYELKVSSQTVGKALSLLSEPTILSMKAILNENLSLFGYSIHKGEDGQYQCVVGDMAPSLQPWSGTSASYTGGAFQANRSDNVRGEGDKYGRMVTMLRRSMTNEDKEPFPVQT